MRIILLVLTFAFSFNKLFGEFPLDPNKIMVYVAPYYNSDGPKIAVGKYSEGLESGNEEKFLQTIEMMRGNWDRLNFLELFVASIRLYDYGYRSESAYWFYTAQYRGRLFARFIDPARKGSIGSPAFELVAAQGAFTQLAGAYISGFAFRDIESVRKMLDKVGKENQIPKEYEKVYPNVKFLEPKEWDKIIEEAKRNFEKYLKYIDDNVGMIVEQRKKNGVEQKFKELTDRKLTSRGRQPAH